MTLLIISFVAGIFTVAAPCILPLLPVIIGASAVSGDRQAQWYRPLVIAAGLAVSVITFTLLLKASTTLLGVPQVVWQIISGSIVTLFGIHFVKPELWEKLPGVNRLNWSSNQLLGKAAGRKNVGGDLLLGAALGPVFSSCSPTYSLLVATVLPASYITGVLYLSAYTIGMVGMLLVIAYAGQAAVRRLGWLANPHGRFRQIIGVLFLLVGLSLIFGLDKKAQSIILDRGWYDPIDRLERRLTNMN